MPTNRADLSLEERARQQPLIREKLGRFPCMSLRAMLDLDLSDNDIARYFVVTPSSVRRLRRVLVPT